MKTSPRALALVLASALVAATPHAGHARMGGGGHGGGMHGGGGGGTMTHRGGAGEFHGGSGGGGSGWRGGDWRGHGFHGHSGPRFFFDAYFYDPFLFPFYGYYYPGPYAYPYPYPDDAYDDGEPDDSSPPYEAPPADTDDAASYGLVRLRGVPDGAAVYLDDRFWLEARDLDERWLAIPAGTHRLSVRVRGRSPIDREVGVAGGQQVTVPFDRRR